MIKRCATCAYLKCDVYDEPCHECLSNVLIRHSCWKLFNEAKGEEKMTQTTKQTKAELLELIDQKNEEIGNLQEELNKLEKYKKYDEAAEEIKAIHDSLTRAGFSDEQAFTLLVTSVKMLL